MGNPGFGGFATRLSRFTLEFSFAIGIKRLLLRPLFRGVVINPRFTLDETVNCRIIRNDDFPLYVATQGDCPGERQPHEFPKAGDFPE